MQTHRVLLLETVIDRYLRLIEDGLLTTVPHPNANGVDLIGGVDGEESASQTASLRVDG